MTSGAANTAGARSLLGAGTSAVLLGIALSAGGSPELGSWLTLSALVVVIYGLHRFGRSGPDEPTGPIERRKKKRKRRAAAPDTSLEGPTSAA